MVNTVVTFGNTRTSSGMLSTHIVDMSTDRSYVWRGFYALIGFILVLIVIIPTVISIRNDRDDFIYHLLLIVHSSSSMILFIQPMKSFDDIFLGFLYLFIVIIVVYRSNYIDLYVSI
jgi:hypothetical protein